MAHYISYGSLNRILFEQCSLVSSIHAKIAKIILYEINLNKDCLKLQENIKGQC